MGFSKATATSPPPWWCPWRRWSSTCTKARKQTTSSTARRSGSPGCATSTASAPHGYDERAYELTSLRAYELTHALYKFPMINSYLFVSRRTSTECSTGGTSAPPSALGYVTRCNSFSFSFCSRSNHLFVFSKIRS